MSTILQPVILSGGSGSRLWPMSRAMYPKQLLPMVSEQTLLQDTVNRLDGLKDFPYRLMKFFLSRISCQDLFQFAV